MGDNQPYPQCHQWRRAGDVAKLIEDHPTSCSPPRRGRGTSNPATPCPPPTSGIWKTLTKRQIPILAMQDTLAGEERQGFGAGRLPGKGGDAESCRTNGPRCSPNAPDPRLPLPVPDDEGARRRATRCARTTTTRHRGNVLIYHDSHHLSSTYMHGPRRELGRQLSEATGWW